MLLIFFLVTTSMDADKGLSRQLPPANEQKEVPPTDVVKGMVLTLRLTAADSLLLNGQPADVAKLRPQVVEFVNRVGKKHLISVDTDPNSSYDAYFRMQNEIVAAYRQLRNRAAQRQYGRPYARCTEQQKDDLRAQYPQRIVEKYNLQQEGGTP